MVFICLTLVYFREREDLSYLDFDVYTVESHNLRKFTLTVDFSDAGRYRCCICNGFGCAWTDVAVITVVAPHVQFCEECLKKIPLEEGCTLNKVGFYHDGKCSSRPCRPQLQTIEEQICPTSNRDEDIRFRCVVVPKEDLEVSDMYLFLTVHTLQEYVCNLCFGDHMISV